MADAQVMADFDEWLRYVFDRPVYEDEAWYWKVEHLFDPDAADSPQVPRDLVVRHLTRLFVEPVVLLERFTLEQVNQGLWYIASDSCSDHARAVLDMTVPWPERERCIESAYNLNERLFVVSCEDVCSHVRTPDNPLNGVCYMWWDLIPLGIERDYPEDYLEQLDRPIETGRAGPDVRIDPASLRKQKDAHRTMLATMERILTLPSIACREGALHLGHFHEHYPREVERIVDMFLVQAETLPKELAAYAKAAREGRVL